MLKTFSEQIVADLNAHQPLLDLLDKDAISALVSEEEDGESFINYFIEFNPEVTKDNASDYQVIIESWSVTYDKSITIADQVTAAIKASDNHYEYLSAKSEPVRFEKQFLIVTKQIFNIKQ